MPGSVISVVNEKGGVGKTTLSIQISRLLKENNKKTLIIDNDPSGDATTAIFAEDVPEAISHGNKPTGYANTIKLYSDDEEFQPLKVEENLYILGSTDTLSMINQSELDPAYAFADAVEKLIEEFDYIVIDCPPSFGTLFTAAMLSASYGGVLIPSTPDELSFKASRKVVERIKIINKRISANINLLGVVANKVLNPPPISVSVYLEDMKEEYGDMLFDTVVHQAVAISDAIACQERIVENRRSKKAVSQMKMLTAEIQNRLEKRGEV